MKIGIYGGSFNPIHYGHLNVAQSAIADLGLDRLIVIPANVSPFKTDADGLSGTEAMPPRLEMVRAVFAAVGRAEVDDRELRRGGVSYAIDTVREIAAENPGAEIWFVVGEDSVEGLPRWKDYDELKRLCSFKAYPRTKESSSEIRALFRNAGVVMNPDAQLANAVREGVFRKNGFCPCRLAKRPEYFCPCDEFKNQLKDDGFSGYCHCRLYFRPSK